MAGVLQELVKMNVDVTARTAAVDAGRVGGRQRYDNVGAGCPVAARLLAQNRLVCNIAHHRRTYNVTYDLLLTSNALTLQVSQPGALR
jgi:hypothetical protein